jgi:hypothetical protein
MVIKRQPGAVAQKSRWNNLTDEEVLSIVVNLVVRKE